jgi:hypothetical protein
VKQILVTQKTIQNEPFGWREQNYIKSDFAEELLRHDGISVFTEFRD